MAFGHSRPGDLTAVDEIDLGSTAVLPGLVNAHTHLELSWMHDRAPGTGDFPAWIRSVIALRRDEGIAEEQIAHAVRASIEEAHRFGTALVGDVSNTLATSGLLAECDLPGVVFHELLGFRSDDAGRIVADALERLQRAAAHPSIRHTLSAHAPYSVSPALFRSIHDRVQGVPGAPSSVHLGESLAELEFLKRGTGPWRSLLEDLGVWDHEWTVPRCGPVEYLDSLGVLSSRLLVVHGVHLESAELERLKAAGATLVTCPRGNLRTGAGVPPLADFFDAGLNVAVGTDSLASVPDLNVFAEIAEMRRLAPALPARSLLESATINGARALGFDQDFGSIDAGKRARLISIELEPSTANVEERLVSGVEASQIRWLTP